LASDNSRVISELKPVNGIEEVKHETKLTVLVSFYVLNESIKAHVEQQRAKAIAL
jgi:hypothetical protein